MLIEEICNAHASLKATIEKDPSACLSLEPKTQFESLEAQVDYLLMVRMFRPESYLLNLQKLIHSVFSYPEFNGKSLSLAQITHTQVHSKMPILLISLKGFDCSFKVDALSKAENKKCYSIAIGDASSLVEAEKAI